MQVEKFDRHKHWENIYHTKQFNEVSWYQAMPTTSLELIKQSNIPATAKIMDAGGGDSLLVDYLLDLDYKNISVLDISETALNKAKSRLGERANNIRWINADVTQFKPTEKYDLWHDRATFHFLIQEHEIETYINTIYQNMNPGGALIIGTFSENGPEKCSGINIKQYSETSMEERLKEYFQKIRCITANHQTPFGTIQNFIFCSFKKL